MVDTIQDESDVPEFLNDAIQELLFKNDIVTYQLDNYYSPSRTKKKAHIISDKSPDGQVTMKRFIVNYVTHGGMVEIFQITQDKNTF